MARAWSFLIVALAFFLVGCQSEVPLVKVHGKVTVDDAPVEKGFVQFEPADGKSPSAKGGTITNGEYTAEVPVGEMIVRISGSKVVGQKKAYDTPESPMRDVLKDVVPAKYYKDSKLKADIKPGMPELDFKLSTK
jgi:hypothetical protein